MRITTRSEAGRAAIEASGAECWVGTPERLATLRGVLDGVAIACWMFARAQGSERELRELHSERLEFFLTQVIDSTVRGFVFEGAGAQAGAGGAEDGAPHDTRAAALAAGEATARRLSARNEIPLELLHAAALEDTEWLAAAGAAIQRLLDRA